MGYVIYHKPLGGYIEKSDGMNVGHSDPRHATVLSVTFKPITKRCTGTRPNKR